jgi:hypothetical protein
VKGEMTDPNGKVNASTLENKRALAHASFAVVAWQLYGKKALC